MKSLSKWYAWKSNKVQCIESSFHILSFFSEMSISKYDHVRCPNPMNEQLIINISSFESSSSDIPVIQTSNFWSFSRLIIFIRFTIELFTVGMHFCWVCEKNISFTLNELLVCEILNLKVELLQSSNWLILKVGMCGIKMQEITRWSRISVHFYLFLVYWDEQWSCNWRSGHKNM